MPVTRVNPGTPEGEEIKHQAKPVGVRVSYMWMTFILGSIVVPLYAVLIPYFVGINGLISETRDSRAVVKVSPRVLDTKVSDNEATITFEFQKPQVAGGTIVKGWAAMIVTRANGTTSTEQLHQLDLSASGLTNDASDVGFVAFIKQPEMSGVVVRLRVTLDVAGPDGAVKERVRLEGAHSWKVN